MRIFLLVVSPCAAMSKCSRTEGNRLLHIKCLLIFLLLSHSARLALCQQRRKINIVNMQMNLVRLVALELRNFVISLLLGVPFLLTDNSSRLNALRAKYSAFRILRESTLRFVVVLCCHQRNELKLLRDS